MTRVKLEKPAVRDAAAVRVAIVEAAKQLKSTFIQRDDAIDAIWVSMLAGANFILVGDPGTAKTLLANSVFAHVTEARRFDLLCGSFVSPDEIFGPVDIMAMKGRELPDGTVVPGTFRRVTDGRLADCEFGFLDELLKSNKGAVNSMLTALNEKQFAGKPIPLRCCGAATNWPEVRNKDEIVSAFWDRVLVRVPVTRITSEDDRMRLLEAAEKVRAYVPRSTVTLAELDAVRGAVDAIEIRDVMRRQLVRTADAIAKSTSIKVSDRRLAQVQRVLRAAAWLAGRTTVELDDFDVLRFAVWDDSEAQYNAAKAVIEGIDQEPLRLVLTKIQRGLDECKKVAKAEHAPEAAKKASELVLELQEHIATVKRSNWAKHVAPLVKQFKEQQQRLTDLIRGGMPKGSAVPGGAV